METFLLLLTAIVAAINIASGLVYFHKVKTIWRHIKLVYSICNLVVFILSVQFLLGKEMAIQTLLLLIIMLMITQMSGMIISYIKLEYKEKDIELRSRKYTCNKIDIAE